MAEPESLGDPIGEGTQYALHLKPVTFGTQKAAAEGYYASITKDAPLRLLQAQLAPKLDVPTHSALIVYEGRKLDVTLGLDENGVTLPGPRRRRAGEKLEIFFDLDVQESLKEQQEEEEQEAREEAEKLAAIAAEQARLMEEEKERLRLEEERRREKKTQEQRAKAEAAKAFEEAGGPPAAAPDAAMPQLNFRRLMAEFRKLQRSLAKEELPWLMSCDPVGENLLTWEVAMTFPEDSSLQQSLERLATETFDDEKDRVTLQVRFPPEYPTCPPEVWLKKPRLKYSKGVGVTFGGKVCSESLISSNWDNSRSMVAVLEDIRASLVAAGAEVDLKISKLRDYAPAPPALHRLRTSAFEKANNFEIPQITAISAVEAAKFLGDQTELERSDKITLPFHFANQIYGREDFETPLIFEVKSRLGRKTHCAIFEFAQGLPQDTCLLPSWVMDDLFVEDRAPVKVRGVKLPLIEYVKIQPHSIEFYDAVQKAGGDVQPLLVESIKRYSALTVETSVPIEILGETFEVLIMELKPAGAVRVIDTDVTREFEFKVEFEAAPDLEDEEIRKARQDEMVAKFKAKQLAQQEEEEAQLRSLEERRVAAKTTHYEEIRKKAVAEAGADDGSSGDLDIALRLPSGQRKGKFREGAPAAALVAFALTSEWAASSKPWGVTLRLSFPRKVLEESDTLTKDMHRSAVSVQEVEAPNDDEELFGAVGKEGALVRSGADAPELASQHELPELDEDKLQHQTQLAFAAQCFIQAGISPEDAVRFAEEGRPLPSVAVLQGPVRQAPRPAARAPAPARAAPAPPRDDAALREQAFDQIPIGQEHLAQPPQPGDEHYQELRTVIEVTGCTPWGARQVLQAHGWEVAAAVDVLLGMH